MAGLEPQIPQPIGPEETSSRQSRLNTLTSALPTDQALDVQKVFAQKTLDRTGVESYIRALPTDSDTKKQLWDTYFTYEPPKPRPPTPPAPQEPGWGDIVKNTFLHPSVSLSWVPEAASGAAAIAKSAAKSAVQSERDYQASQIPAPPKPPDISRPVGAPNTPLTAPGPFPKTQLALPPLPSTGTRKIAGTYGNALVMDDGSQIAQNTKNLQIYHDSGYPELTSTDLRKLASGQPIAPKGLTTPGTISNLYNRPILKNEDGSISTTRSMSFDEDGQEVVVPTVVDGKQLTNQQAIERYRQTGEHLGKFSNVPDAEAYAQNLHESQAGRLGMPPENLAAPFRPPLTPDPEALRTKVAEYERTAIQNLGGLQPVEPSPWTEVAKDMYRRTVRGAEAGLSGATLGMAQAATGDIHIPILDKNLHVLPGAEDKLKELGLAAPADRWQTATNTITSLLAMGAPWAKISRTLAPLYGTVETGVAANIMSRLENTLGTAFVVGAVEPKDDDQSRLEHIATTMGGAAIFHTLAETAGGIGTALKIKTINDLKGEVAEVLYGRRPDTFDEESARKMANDLVDQSIGEQGGVENVSRQALKEKLARTKEAARGPKAFAGPDQQVGPAVGGPGTPMPESTPEAPQPPAEDNGIGVGAGAPIAPPIERPAGGWGAATSPPEVPPAPESQPDRRTSDQGPPAEGERRRPLPGVTDQMARNHLGLEDDVPPPGHVFHGDELVSNPPEDQESRIDRIRGSVDLPLTLSGLVDVQKLGKTIAEKGGVDSIVSADLKRTQQTARTLAQETGAPVRETPNLRDIAYGGLEGKPSHEAIGEINDKIVNDPDEPFGGQSEHSSTPGESFNQYKARLLPEVQNEMQELDKNPDSKRVMVVNRRSIKTIEGWIKAGAGDDLATDGKTVTGFGADTEPGSIHRLFRDHDGNWKVQDVDGLKDFKRIPGGIFFVRHGETAWNGKAAPSKEQAAPAPEKAQTPEPAESPELPELQRPKKVFKLNGQDVAAIRGQQVQLADGTFVDKIPSFIKTLKLYGYQELPEETKPVEAPPAHKDSILAAIQADRSGAAGVPLSLPTLRKSFPYLSKQDFDQSILQLADDGKIWLTRHDHGHALSQDKQDELVQGNTGEGPSGLKPLYVAAALRERVAPPETNAPPAETKAETPEPVEGPKQPQKGYKFSVGDSVKFLRDGKSAIGTVETLGKSTDESSPAIYWVRTPEGKGGKRGQLLQISESYMDHRDGPIAFTPPETPAPVEGPKPEKTVTATDKSVRDHTQQVKISGDTITVTHKVGTRKAAEVSLPLSEWLAAEKGPSANPHFNKFGVINKYFGHLDEQEGGPGQAQRIRDSIGKAIDAALAKRIPETPSATPPTGLRWETTVLEYSTPDGKSKDVAADMYGDRIVYKAPKGQLTGRWVVGTEDGAITDGPFKDKAAARTFVENQAKKLASPPPPVGGPTIPEPPKEEPKSEPKSDFGSRNKFFNEDDAEAARKRLRDKFKTQFNVGFDPEMLSDMFKLGGYYFEAGVREFGAWAERMIEDVGEAIRPYLQSQFDLISQWFKDHPEALGEEEHAGSTGSVEGHGPDERPGERDGQGGAGGGDGGGLRGQQPAEGSGGAVRPGESDQRPDEGVSGGQPAERPAAAAAKPERVERSARERFTLIGKEPVALTPQQRRDINARARELAETKSPGDPLTPEEQDILRQYTGQGGLQSAEEGVLFQHYTSYRMVQWQWNKLQAMGYPLEGASMLEPAAGIGNYAGFAPAGTKITMVEIDPTAAKIAQLLYPHANVQNKPFEEFITKQKYDVIISNVPFHADRGELRYSKDAEEYKNITTLHDFFFMKSLDLAKPNGIVAFLTSTGTMDKASPEIRKLISEKAEFLGAYRTPAGEFQKNTQYGGSVDAIYLRKRTPEEIEALKAVQAVAGGNFEFKITEEPKTGEWINARDTDQFSKSGQPPARLNDYYLKNQEQMWGKPEAGYGVRQVTRIGVRPTKPIDEFMSGSLTDAIKWVPRETQASVTGYAETEAAVGKAPEGMRHGTLVYDAKKTQLNYASGDGNLYPAFPLGLPKNTHDRVVQAVRMMDLTGKLYDALRENDIKAADKLRPQLLQAIQNYRTQFASKDGKNKGKLAPPPGYDNFLYRFVGGGTEKMPLNFADPRIWTLAGLTDRNGKPSAVFTTNTIWKPIPPDRKYDPQNIEDVSRFVYEKTGEFNKADVEERYRGKGQVDELLVGRPGFSISALSADGKPTIAINDDFLYGPIWPKIDQTEAMIQQVQADPSKFDAGILPALDRQMQELTAALPPQATVNELPADPFSSFMDQGTLHNWLKFLGMNAELEYVPENNRHMWKVGGGTFTRNIVVNKKTGERADHKYDAENVQDFLNHARATTKVATGEYDYNGRAKTKTVFDLQGQDIQDQIGEFFTDWFKANLDRVEHLVPTYNRMYRSFRHPTFEGKEQAVEGLAANFKGAPLVIHKHQWEATEQLLRTRSGINAHGVGAGKTSQAITMLAVARQRGLIHKPLLVVPAKVAGNWAYEIGQLFPTANVLNLSEMNSKNRNRMLHQAAMSQPDYIIASYEGMKEVPLRASEDYLEEDIRQYEDRLRQMKEKSGPANKKMETVIQDQIRKMRGKLAAIQDMKKTNAIFFEDTGIDSLVWDEMHALKNAPVQYMDMSEWLHAASYSQRAADAMYKTRYIHERASGRKGQNVWGLTATPTPNNPIEIYSMLKYIAPDEWTDRGIMDAGQFVNNFGIVGQTEEAGTTGVPKVRVNFIGYKNMNDLRPIFRRYIDMRPTKAFAIKRPDAQYVEHVLNPSPEVSFEAARIADIDDWITRDFKGAAANGWIPINLLTVARKLAADLAVYNPIRYRSMLGRPGSKLSEIIQQVKQSDQGDNTQLIFMDLYRAVARVAVGGEEEKLIKMFLEDGNVDHIKAIDVEDDSDNLSNDESTDGEDQANSEVAPTQTVTESPDPEAKAKMKTYELVNIHKELKKALVALGIPEDQIAIVNQSTNNGPKKKFAVQQANAEGKIRFLIGTTASMGEGMNLQTNTTDIHHYDVPWTPAALEQREGRGVRQGNIDPKTGKPRDLVRVHRYVGKGTSDAKMYAVLARKAKWLEELWFGDQNEVMDFDQDHRNYADISADAQIDTSTLEYWQTHRRIGETEKKLQDVESDDIVEARRMLEKVNDEIAGRQARIDEYTKQIQNGTGSVDYAQRMIDQHRSGIEALEQEKLKREDIVKQADSKAAEYRASLDKDRPRLQELIAEAKSKGMPVLPEHEGDQPVVPTVPKPVQGPVPNQLGTSAMRAIEGPASTGLDKATTSFSPVRTKPSITVDGKTYPSKVIRVSQGSDGLRPVSAWDVAPGLAVHQDLNERRQYVVTHTLSGLRITNAGTPEAAIFKANRVASLGDWERSAEDLQSDKPFMEAVQQKLRGEAGALNFWRGRTPAPIQPNLIPSQDPDMRRLVSLPGPQGNIWTKMRAIPAEVYRFATSSRYNEDIKDFPLFAERVRRAQEIINDAAGKTQKQMEAVVKGLHPTEFDVFRAIIFWEDMYETGARSGESRIPLAGTNKLARLDAEIQRLRSIATPNALAAVDRHHQWMEDLWNDFVARGKADPNDGRAKYFPNMLINELGDALDRLPGLPTRMQTPRRLYLKERTGHTTPHDADWIRVMEQYGTRAYAHNMIDDFIESTATENDVLPKLNQQQRMQLLGPSGEVKPRKAYRDQAGNVLKGFQFNPGNIIYPVQAVNEEVIQDALHAGLDEMVVDIDAMRRGHMPPPLMTDMGEELTRRAFALGGKHKVYLLPAPIADKLEHFRENNQIGPFTELIRAATNAWKLSVTGLSGGLTYFSHITIGNQMTLWAEDMGALAKQPEALNILRKKLTPPQYQQIVDLMEEARIWNSTFMASGGVPRAANAPGLRPYRETSALEKITPWGNNPIGDVLREFQRWSNIVHSLPKVAKFLADMERIQQGKPLNHKGSNTAGLPPIMAAGKAARELTTDYGATSQRMRFVYSTVFPFSSFAVGIVGPWLRRATQTGKIFPGDEFLMKILLPIVAIMIWNHYMYPSLEKDVPDWQKEMTHINTPFRDADGKPIVIALETPVDVVKRWGGLHTLEPNVDKALDGRWTWEQAARQQVEDIFGHQARATWPTAPGAMLEEMMNPMLKIMFDLKANRDSFTGREIVSKSEPNLWGDPAKAWPQTDTGKQMYREYVAKQMISPYMQYLRAQQMDSPDSMIWNLINSSGPFAWKRALGIRSVDPNQGARADWYNDKTMMGSLRDEDLRKIDDAYVESESDNISDADRDAIILPILQRAELRGSPVPTTPQFPGQSSAGQTDVDRMLKSPEHQIRVVDEVLRKTTDPGRRKDLLAARMALQQQVDAKSFKAMPKEVAPYVGLPPIPGPPSLFMPDLPAPPQ